MLHPKIDSSIEEYVKTKIDDSEQRLLQDALQLKVKLKAIDSLPNNGILPIRAKMQSKLSKQICPSTETMLY